MDTSQALSVLKALQPHVKDVQVEFGSNEDEAYLLLTRESEPNRWAVVTTPGSRYLSVETDGLYSKDQFGEHFSDDEVKSMLGDFVNIAAAYVQGSGDVTRTGFLKTPALLVDVDGRQERLTLGISAMMKSFFRSQKSDLG